MTSIYNTGQSLPIPRLTQTRAKNAGLVTLVTLFTIQTNDSNKELYYL